MSDVNKKDFFSKWTLMEALAKADGRGLSFIEETLSDKKIKNLANMLLKDGFGNVYSLSAALKENTD
jgi:hypothetical protein